VRGPLWKYKERRRVRAPLQSIVHIKLLTFPETTVLQHRKFNLIVSSAGQTESKPFDSAPSSPPDTVTFPMVTHRKHPHSIPRTPHLQADFSPPLPPISRVPRRWGEPSRRAAFPPGSAGTPRPTFFRSPPSFLPPGAAGSRTSGRWCFCFRGGGILPRCGVGENGSRKVRKVSTPWKTPLPAPDPA
jgi:hypothetical protein